MNFDDFQKFIEETAIYPHKGDNLAYPALGLTGEAGEVADKVKKLIRDHDGKLTPELAQEMVKELGDVLWYLAALSLELKVNLSDVAAANVKKLRDRKKRGVLKGDGDNR
jgi:NTP pyrophosphatase (non-canonical NTP hydrolase)